MLQFCNFFKGRFKLKFCRFLAVFLTLSFFSFNVSASNIPMNNWSVTYYETKKAQTDNTPCIGARNIDLCRLMKRYPKITVAAVSRDFYWKFQKSKSLFNVFCPGITYKNVFIVDKMHWRFKRKIDILDNDINKSFAFNKRECRIEKVKNPPYKKIDVPRIHWRTKKATKPLKIELEN